MAYQSSYGSNYPYARDSFGGRYAEAVPARRGVSRTLFFCTLFAALLFAIWAGAATFYFLFRDEVLQTLASRQIETSRAAEMQIAALHTEIERLRSTKFVDQERVDQQLSELSRIQRTIDARHNALAAIAQAVARNPDVTGSIPANAPLRNAPAPVDQPSPDAKPRPLSDTMLFAPAVQRAAAVTNDKRQRDLAAIASKLAKLSAQQTQALHAVELEVDQRGARMKKAVAALGPDLPAASRTKEPPAGGPFIPASSVPEDSFMRQVYRIRLAAEEQQRLTKQLQGLPVLLPISGPAEITSSYGLRVDPFLKRLAMHVGVDLRGESGDPVRAAAAGTVVFAGRHNAYGLMVEIDHGNGFTTRYAHLSAILVKEGAVLPAGRIVGKLGSTGRSTAPHLHFEVRLDGDPVDPRRYIRAGMHLAGFQ